MKVQDRAFQKEAVDALFSFMATKFGNPIVSAGTGSGKSFIAALSILEAFKQYSEVRILILSHVTEIITQDHEKLMLLWPNAPAGIYSASLKKRQFFHPIVFGSIQSVYDKAHLLGHRHIVIIDELHQVQGKDAGMYGRLIKELTEINPNIRICGFSATPYRTDSGDITVGENRIFTDLVYEISTKKLIEDGYLCPPISKSPLVQADLDGVKITAGDYNIKQMSARFDQKEFLTAALDGDMHFFEDRKSIAFFCATVENAEHVAEAMCARGIHTETIDGNMSAEDRADKFRRFKSGELRGLASVMVMSVGTDLPNIDCVVMFIATKSPGKYVQIVGRGFRPLYAEGYDLSDKEERLAAIANGKKPNFLVIDHGFNIQSHGPIINVRPPETRQKGQRLAAPKPLARICEVCRTANTLEAISCIICGTELKIERDPTASLSLHASDADIMGSPFSRGEVAEWFNVDDVKYCRHMKKDSEMLRITYHSGILQFDEYKMISWLGEWWAARSSLPKPKTVHDALKWIETLKKPRRVQIRKKNKYYEVLRYEFDEAVQPDAVSGVAQGGNKHY